MTAIAFILILVCGLALGLVDRLQFHYDTVKPINWILKIVKFFWGRIPLFFSEQYWNPDVSWKNKYKDFDKKNGPAFLGSTSVFVFLTDGFHLLRFILINGLFVSLAIYSSFVFGNPFINFIVLRVLFWIGFKITYR